jgi:pimeloyl-ACP methyl ester carboxylesterase
MPKRKKKLTDPLVLTKLMLFGRRAPIDRTPESVGLAYEDVSFPATDGVQLKGWFIPAEGDGPAPAVVFVHGWVWNRLGNRGGQVPVNDADVDFLPATKALHDAGIGVLLFDMRWHGESGRGKRPLTYGPLETADYIGAVQYLRSRADVDNDRIGALGCSMGGNTVMLGTPDAQPIKAVLLVQPTKLHTFNTNFARTEIGPWGPASLVPIDWLYALLRLPRPTKHDPGVGAERLGDTVAQYVQATGDPWGTMEIVEEFAAKTPKLAGPVIKYDAPGRYEGYRFVTEEADQVADYFRKWL